MCIREFIWTILLMFNPVTSHKPFLCSPLETDRKEQKFQTSSSVRIFFSLWNWGLILLFFSKSAIEDLLKVLLAHQMAQVFSLSFYNIITVSWRNGQIFWVNAGCKDPCWLLDCFFFNWIYLRNWTLMVPTTLQRTSSLHKSVLITGLF